jgi:hypothetical protein
MSRALIPRRKVIETSALTGPRVAEVKERIRKLNQIKSPRPKRDPDQPWPEDHVESVPLDTLDSMIGFAEQGDVYRNDLETLYDRIMLNGPAPRYVARPVAPPPAEQASPSAERSQGSLVDPFDSLSDSLESAVGLDTLDNFDPLDTLDLAGDITLQ